MRCSRFTPSDGLRRFISCPFACVALILTAAPLQAGEEAVKIQQDGDAYRVTINGEDFATYNVSDKYLKPFFSPVRSAGGVIVTRPLEDPEDHPHHKGVWLSIDEVNGIQYWAEKGTIKNVSVEVVKQGDPAVMKVVNHWMSLTGKPLLEETSTISIHSNRLMSYDISLAPAGGDAVTFEDTKEGMFGIRLANSIRESAGDGHVVTAEGVKGSQTAWGKPSKWIDYYGPVDGKHHGAAIFDHPENFRPSRYHVRNYGLFTINPFGEKAYTGGREAAKPYTIEPGESLRLRYGLYIHPGDTNQAKVAEVYGAWVKGS